MSSEDPTPPFLVAQDTPTGFRFIRPPGAPAAHLSSMPLVLQFLKVSAALVTAGVVAVYILATRWHDLPEWAHVGGPLYVLQLVLDIGLIGRHVWRVGRYALGQIEIEVAGDQLRAGRRRGPVWIDAPSISLPSLRRLVIVRRPEADGEDPGTSWLLVAEPEDGNPVTLINVYNEPVLVRDLATELHARLSASPELARPLPPLAEEERPADIALPVASADPGGGWLWLVVHVVGLVGLWPMVWLTLNWQDSMFMRLAGGGMALLQALIMLVNISWIKFVRQQTGPQPQPSES